MSTLRFLTAGESHGTQLTAILEGCPAGLALVAADVDRDLRRRQLGYGRGARQQIETDSVDIVGGVRYGRTTGAPIALAIANRDAGNWGDTLSVEPVELPQAPVRIPRPGHADLGGALLYGSTDLRDVIERASARETAARTACGAVARQILGEIGCLIASHVVRVGAVSAESAGVADVLAARDGIDADPLRCADPRASQRMRAAVDEAAACGDTLGGVFEVLVEGFPAGVGSYVHADRRLGAAVAAALMSIPAVKGVEIGLGFAAAGLAGSAVHDEIAWSAERGYRRSSNRAGGIEGGMSTGETIVLRAAMKPIATLRAPLQSVELVSHRAVESRFERSDTCAVPAAAVVGEAVIALCLADALLDRFPAAVIGELTTAVNAVRDRDRRA
jgi:chorismate synthase